MTRFSEDLTKELLIKLREARQAQRANQAASKMEELHPQLRTKARQEADNYCAEAELHRTAIEVEMELLKVEIIEKEEAFDLDPSDIGLKLKINTLKNQLHDTEKQLQYADRI